LEQKYISIENRTYDFVTNSVRSGFRDGRIHYSYLSDISTCFETTCVPGNRNDVEDSLEKRMSALSVEWEDLEKTYLDQVRGQTGR
jgi:hypothetical protein